MLRAEFSPLKPVRQNHSGHSRSTGHHGDRAAKLPVSDCFEARDEADRQVGLARAGKLAPPPVLATTTPPSAPTGEPYLHPGWFRTGVWESSDSQAHTPRWAGAERCPAKALRQRLWIHPHWWGGDAKTS